jgi:ribosomal protein S18 acetylase RimI-like enzyme
MIESIRTRKSADISLKLSLALLACALASAYGFAATSISVDFASASPPTIVDDIVVCPPPRSKIKDSAIVIRSTSFEDLPTVVYLLAFESIPKEVVPFFRNLQIAKNQNAFKIQLKDRLDAIKFTSKAIHPLLFGISSSHTLSLEDINNYRRLLWNHDGIRNRVERAVKSTQEYCHMPTKWDNHNFALVPEPSMLYHFMISAYDNDFVGSSDNGSVVGFCEVMMMNAPNGEVVPSIINLAVSPNHRRRGIGIRMLNCALRRVRLDCSRQQEAMFESHMIDHERIVSETHTFHDKSLIPYPKIGLQVHIKNQGAIQLYEKVGFQIKSEDNEMIYMELDL